MHIHISDVSPKSPLKKINEVTPLSQSMVKQAYILPKPNLVTPMPQVNQISSHSPNIENIAHDMEVNDGMGNAKKPRMNMHVLQDVSKNLNSSLFSSPITGK